MKSLEEMMVSLESSIEKKTEQRDGYLQLAKTAKDEGFHDTSAKLLEIANDEDKQIGVLEEISKDLRNSMQV